MNILNIEYSPKPTDNHGSGVLYVTDADGFPGVQISSLECNYPVAIVDIGMSLNQLKWCAENNITTIKYTGYKPAVTNWQTWIKPLALLLTPYINTLYLDIDTLCIGKLDNVFNIIQKNGILVIEDQGKYYEHDKYETYKKRIPTHTPYEDRYVNAGVIGYNIEHINFIKTYADLCENCFNNNLYDMYSWHDEGCLNQCVDIYSQYIPLDQYEYNRLSPVIPCLTKNKLLCDSNEILEHQKYNYLYSYTTHRKFMLNENINNEHTILHFRGKIKPWQVWTRNQFF